MELTGELSNQGFFLQNVNINDLDNKKERIIVSPNALFDRRLAYYV